MSFKASLLACLLLVGAPAVAAERWPDLADAPKSSSPHSAADAALVVAIGHYEKAPPIPGAVENGRAWVRWFEETPGVGTIKVLEDGQATREEILLAAQGVAERVEPGGRLWVVYIGHGAPSQTAQDGLLVGVDARQTAVSLQSRSISREELLEAVRGPQAETILVVDACFSGMTAAGDLAPGLAPLKAVPEVGATGVTVLTAAGGDQYAGPLSNGARPAFSYLVLGALRGWGDRNGDHLVTAEEAVDYADRALFKTITGRKQTPSLAGPNLTLARGATERGPDLGALGAADGAAGGIGRTTGTAGAGEPTGVGKGAVDRMAAGAALIGPLVANPAGPGFVSERDLRGGSKDPLILSRPELFEVASSASYACAAEVKSYRSEKVARNAAIWGVLGGAVVGGVMAYDALTNTGNVGEGTLGYVLFVGSPAIAGALLIGWEPPAIGPVTTCASSVAR